MTTSLRKGCIGLAILLGYFLLVSLPCPDGLSPNGKRAIAMMFAAVLVWVFEILPVAVASVLFAVLPAVVGEISLDLTRSSLGRACDGTVGCQR